MKLAAVLGCAMIAVASVGGAHAQTATCGQVSKLLASTHAQVKALQGAKTAEDKESTTYTSKMLVDGFKECRIESDKAVDSLSDYWEHNIWCDGEAASSDAANTFIEAVWACTRELYTERHAGEAWIDGRYRIISLEGEAPTAGRAEGLVDFGVTDYARVVLEKAYDTSEEYALHIYWQFTK